MLLFRFRQTRLAILLVAAWLVTAESSTEAQDIRKESSFEIPGNVAKILKTYCVSCHGPAEQEAGIRLDQLASLDLLSRNEVLANVQKVVRLKQMPPEDEDQLKAEQYERLTTWLGGQLRKSDSSSKLDEKLQRFEYANYTDHKKLFSGEFAELQGFTYDRRWLISQYIFDAKVNRILNHRANQNIDGKRYPVIGNNNRRVNLTNPFLLPTRSGVRYYANEALNGGHLLTMLTNAKEISSYMMYLAGRDRRYMPAITEIMALREKQSKTLEQRKRFLELHIERLLVEEFGTEHESLLPDFVRVASQPAATQGKTKKAPFHAANPGQAELAIIFRSMRKHDVRGQNDETLIEKCERDWFYMGHNERKIQARVTFLKNYMPEWRGVIKQHRYDQRHKPVTYRALADAEMEVIRTGLRKHRRAGDRYNAVASKCLAEWKSEFERERKMAAPPTSAQIAALIEQCFVKILERKPKREEQLHYEKLTHGFMKQLGRPKAIEKLLQTLVLNTEFVYRNEFGQGKPDAHGRKMMSPRDASYAIAYALTDSGPDPELTMAAKEGRLQTRADYEREIRRILANRNQHYIIDEAVNRPNDLANFTTMPIRELRFFREFFGYPKLLPVFKDSKRFGANYDAAKKRLVTEADRLIEHILERDKNVFEELLTTERFYVFHSGDNAAMQASSDRIRRIYDYFKDKDWQNFTLEDLAKHSDFISEVKMRGIDTKRLKPGGRYNPLGAFKRQVESFTLRLDKGQTAAAPYNSFPAHGMANASSRYGGRLQSPEVAKFFNVDMSRWDYATDQPTKLPHRKGILTHPAWLIAFAHNTETDPIRRGKWIQEKLLAGTIPDLPITVDAVIPEDPHKTLRQRLELKTGHDECWKCHRKMEPLGLPFEMYDDFGRYRTQERLEYPINLIKKVKDKGAPHEDLRDIYKTLPVDAHGELKGTGDSRLDGKVENALELIERLGKSERVRQSIIRHAFRYFLGRNETLSDSKTLIDAEQAYLKSGGSFDEVIVALLTSDSFIYRKPQEK